MGAGGVSRQESVMSFDELCKMVADYAARYNCTLAESIQDLEFDGPEGSHGPSREDVDRLYSHFNLEPIA